MSADFCTGCGQPATGEPFCGNCGTASRAVPVPSVAKEPRPGVPRWVLATGAVALVAVGGLGAAQAGLIPVGSLAGASIEDVIQENLAGIYGPRVAVECPSRIPQQKNRITDCQATFGSGRSGAVYVEQVDTGGHFRFQLDSATAQQEIEDKIEKDAAAATAKAEREAAEFAEQIEKDTEAAIAALPRDSFVDTCAGAYSEAVCGCVFDALGEKAAQDDALLGFLINEPTPAARDAAEGCRG